MGPGAFHVFGIFFLVATATWVGGYLELLKKKSWANLSTVSVLLGLMGLVGIFMDSSRRFAELELEYFSTAYGSEGEIIKTSASWKREYLCNTKFEKSDLSPPDFDVVVRDQGKLCHWFTDLEKTVSAHPFEKFAQVKNIIPIYPVLEGDGWDHELREFERDVDQQDQWLAKLRQMSSDSKVEGMDFLYYWFAPFSVAAALGIQFGKSRYS